MKTMPLYQFIVQTITHKERCVASGNDEWKEVTCYRLKKAFEALPQGGGFDNGTKLVKGSSSCLVFQADFHHLDKNGGYDGWTYHVVRVWPDLEYGFRLTVSGRNKNEIKDYIAETFQNLLSRQVSLSEGIYHIEGLPPAYSFYAKP